MVNPDNYFDVFDILINEVVGSQLLFFFLGFVIILFITLKTRMNFQMSIMLSLLWGLIYVGMTGDFAIWALAGAGVVFLISIMVARFFRRG